MRGHAETGRPKGPSYFCETDSLAAGRLSERNEEAGGEGRFAGWMHRKLVPARSSVHRWPAGRHVWRIGIAALGLAVVIAGIVMLVFPGPGWLVIFLGFAIWATEFPWAASVATFVRRRIASCTSWIKRQPRWLLAAVVALCVLAAGVFVLLVLL